jgi:hypothetical protein
LVICIYALVDIGCALQVTKSFIQYETSKFIFCL